MRNGLLLHFHFEFLDVVFNLFLLHSRLDLFGCLFLLLLSVLFVVFFFVLVLCILVFLFIRLLRLGSGTFVVVGRLVQALYLLFSLVDVRLVQSGVVRTAFQLVHLFLQFLLQILYHFVLLRNFRVLLRELLAKVAVIATTG